MQEVNGDIFEYPADALVIPTNMQYRESGGKRKPVYTAVMGAGVANQAARRWPSLPRALGAALHESEAPHIEMFEIGDMVQMVLAFPTKHHYRDDSSMELIKDMIAELVALADQYEWEVIVMPRIGCGLGNRDWETEVKPMIQPMLDSRFVVIHRP